MKSYDPAKSTSPFHAVVLALGCAALLWGGSAHAETGDIILLQEFGSSDRPMVVAASHRGIVLINAEHQLFRGFTRGSSDPGSTPFLWIEDIDNDRKDEIVGAGNPSFVVDDNGDPMWGITSGCDDFFLGNMFDRNEPEVFCRRGREVKVWSYDGQFVFEWAGRGYSIESCHPDDFDSDQEMEVGCNLSNGNHLMFDLSFAEPAQNEGSIQSDAVGGAGRAIRRSQSAAAGERELDAGGQMIQLTPDVGPGTFTRDGAPVSPQGIGASEIHSALVADIDGDGNHELYLGGTDSVYVVSVASGELLSTVHANPSSLDRDARVTVRSATASGLADSDRETVRSQVEAGLDDIKGCYARRMGDDQTTRVGNMLWELTVNDSGRVTNATRRHSDLRDERLEGCVEDKLEDLGFSAATSGTGTVSIRLEFDFVDTPG